MRLKSRVVWTSEETNDVLLDVYYGDIIFKGVVIKKCNDDLFVFESQTKNPKNGKYYKNYILPESLKDEILEDFIKNH